MRESIACAVCATKRPTKCEACGVPVCSSHASQGGHPCGPHGAAWLEMLDVEPAPDECAPYVELPPLMPGWSRPLLCNSLRSPGGKELLRVAFRPTRHALTDRGWLLLERAAFAGLDDCDGYYEGDEMLLVSRVAELLDHRPFEVAEAIVAFLPRSAPIWALHASARGAVSPMLLETFWRTK